MNYIEKKLRRTGRTTRMIKEAFECAQSNPELEIIIIFESVRCADFYQRKYKENIIECPNVIFVGYGYIKNRFNFSGSFIGCVEYFATYHPSRHLLFDHSVIESFLESSLLELHRYDDQSVLIGHFRMWQNIKNIFKRSFWLKN